jgi:hypothetical protein
MDFDDLAEVAGDSYGEGAEGQAPANFDFELNSQEKAALTMKDSVIFLVDCHDSMLR